MKKIILAISFMALSTSCAAETSPSVLKDLCNGKEPETEGLKTDIAIYTFEHLREREVRYVR